MMLVALMAASPFVSAYDVMVDKIGYNVDLEEMTAVAVSSELPTTQTKITVPSSIEFRGRTFKVVEIKGAFINNLYITEAEVSEGINKMQSSFSGCKKLKKIILPSTYDSTGFNFSGCSSLSTIIVNQSELKIGYKDFEDCISLTTVPIPISEIGDYGLAGCESLEKITFADTIKNYIGDRAFYNCKKLKYLKFTPIIGEYRRFRHSYDMIYGAASNYGVEIFCGCTGLETLELCGKIITLAPRITDKHFFSGCDNLKELKLSNCIFRQIVQDKSRIDPSGQFLTYEAYEGYPFRNLPLLAKLTMNSDVDYNFDVPSNLKELVLGNHVNNFRINWRNDWQLESITILCNTPPEVEREPMASNYINLKIRVPYEALEAYKSHTIWGNFWDINEMEPSGFSQVSVEEKEELCRYDLTGNVVPEDYKGIVIIRNSDGSIRKQVKR